jgi:hypothetical protein
MKKRTSSFALVLVAAVALVLGSLGTASAVGLTVHQVKKIAAKVVKKKAPGLSVAHAATADNATNATLLNGQPSTAYQTPTFQYLLPIQAAATTRTYTFPGLPAGNYIASYDILTANGTATKHDCEFVVGTQREAWGYSTPGYIAGFSSVAGSTFLAVGTPAPTLFCEANGTWAVSAGGLNVNNRVVFTRVNPVTNGTPVGTKADSAASGPASAQ